MRKLIVAVSVAWACGFTAETRAQSYSCHESDFYSAKMIRDVNASIADTSVRRSLGFAECCAKSGSSRDGSSVLQSRGPCHRLSLACPASQSSKTSARDRLVLCNQNWHVHGRRQDQPECFRNKVCGVLRFRSALGAYQDRWYVVLPTKTQPGTLGVPITRVDVEMSDGSLKALE
jgi:hypothetical protein